MRHPAPFVALLALLAGCTVRSISDTQPWSYSNPTFAGEITDLDVVGVAPMEVLAGEPALRAGQRVLVVQSGAMFPDELMLAALREHCTVGTASGMPTRAFETGHGLRNAAQRGGYDAVLAYWGVLETSSTGTAGKAASWVPIAGFFVTDEIQRMRIRLRLVLVDAKTGAWRSFLPTPGMRERDSSFVTRSRVDAELIEALKTASYREAVAHLLAAPAR